MNKQHNHHVTRGFGFLETILAKKRSGVAEKLISREKRNGRVLDIGCGSFPYFLMSTKFNEKHGVDASINEKLFKNSHVKIKKLQIGREKLPYEDDFFDVVVMLAVFEHISPEYIVPVLKEVYRVLKKNGQLIITTPSPWSVPILWWFSRIGLISKVEIEDHKSAFSSGMIKQFIEEACFENGNIENGYFELSFNMWFSAKK